MVNAIEGRRIHRVSALVFSLAILFCLFFQVNKLSPLREANPFAQDPYDAVGSFSIQVALVVSVLTYSRALRLRGDASQSAKSRLILRGNLVVLLVIFATLFADAVAETVHRAPPSCWGAVLQWELTLIFMLTLLCAIAVAVTFGSLPTGRPPDDLTPADGLDDLWTLVRVPVVHAGRWLPVALVEWVRQCGSDTLFARLGWLDPRRHAWRFAGGLGLLAGITLASAQLLEGLPPSLEIGVLVTGLFLGGELIGTFLGFAVLGGYLGLRPSLHGGDRSKVL
jgi:hypothetical protein